MQLVDIDSTHMVDKDGNPAGGLTVAPGMRLEWQNGPGEVQTGAVVEQVIQAAIDRLSFYQEGKFASEYNKSAINYLRGAKRVLNERTADREARGVEGTHEV